MKKYIPLLLLILAFTGCNSDDDCNNEVNLDVDQTKIDEDIAIIDAYLAENNIQAQEHPSGLRYVILDEGEENGENPEICTVVYVDYVGRLFDTRSVFEDTDGRPTRIGLVAVIPGWQIGIPLIKKGGSIRLYIPSELAYGDEALTNNSGQIVIPENSILEFDVNLILIE